MRSSKQRNASSGKSRGNSQSKKSQPPQIPSNVTITRTYRFKSTSATMQSITGAQILGVAGAVCTVANTTLRYLATSVRVHRVSVWSPPSAQGAEATCTLEWKTYQGDEYKEVSDSSMSVARPAHISSKPPQGSLCWLPMGVSSGTCLDLTAPVGSIIDVHCTHVLNDTATAGSSYAVGAASLGVIYYLPLDGSTDVFTPVGLQTTT